MSQKPFMWDLNSPYEYADPSGLYVDASGHTPGWYGDGSSSPAQDANGMVADKDWRVVTDAQEVLNRLLDYITVQLELIHGVRNGAVQ
jgi:hypothetical protein